MAVLSQLTRSHAMEVDELRLYATDSLDYENGSHLRDLLSLIPDEAHRQFLERRVAISSSAKQHRGYRLVIGNPPYKNNGRLNLAQVAERFPALLGLSSSMGRR